MRLQVTEPQQQKDATPKGGPAGSGLVEHGAPSSVTAARSGFAHGARQVVVAGRLLWHDAELRRAALVATLWTLAGCALVSFLALGPESKGHRLKAFFVAFAAATSLPPTLLYPLWVKLGQRARVALGGSPGDTAFAGRSYPRMLWSEGFRAVRQLLVVSAGLAPLFFLTEALLPGGRWLSVGLAAAWSLYWVVLDALELPMELAPGKLGEGSPTWFERGLKDFGAKSRLLRPFAWTGRWVGRLSKPWRHAVQFTERRPFETLGFGLAVGLVLLVPVLGIFFRSVAIAAATGLLVGAEREAGRFTS